MSSIDLPELADLPGLAPLELARVLTDLDMARRKVDAMIAESLDAVIARLTIEGEPS